MRKVHFDYSEINGYNAWLLGFIYADGLIRVENSKRVLKVYNKSQILLEKVVKLYRLPYNVVEQKNTSNNLYFIRIAYDKFVESIHRLGFTEDKTNLRIPKMDKISRIMFLKGFLKGKGSEFKEEGRDMYGYHVIYRSQSLIEDIKIELSIFTGVKDIEPYSRETKNTVSYQLRFRDSECDKIKLFLSDRRYFTIFDSIE